MVTDLASVPYDAELSPGATSAVFTCLNVKPGERVVLITDMGSLPIGAALLGQLLAARAEVAPFVLEDVAERPMKAFPEPIARALERATVSCFTAGAQPGE